MKFLRIPKDRAEEIRKRLVIKGFFNPDYSIVRESKFVFLPISSTVLSSDFSDFDIVDLAADARPKSNFDVKSLLSPHLSQSELGEFISSFDILGNLAIVEIPDKLSKYDSQIGEAVLTTHKNVRSVYKKLGAMEGEFRVRRLSLIAGRPNLLATYVESGVRMRFDVSKVYFSVRLAHERGRIADLMSPSEKVLVFFAGVGPFALVMAKKHKKSQIVAIELNPDAIVSLEENISLNHLPNVTAVAGDVRKVVLSKYLDFADRIVMPLPHSAHEFLDVAFAGIKSGGIVHFYTIVKEIDWSVHALEKAETEARKAGVKIEVVGKRIVRPYSPKEVQVVLDIRVKK
ncbi:class I SAM-dependent methyltransferase family protein [Candidatus Micrarchaeota archaeon]|nr:class I SAM-dependent methyltransferase family protein [Candidatus Micrarchaeota archaeon]